MDEALKKKGIDRIQIKEEKIYEDRSILIAIVKCTLTERKATIYQEDDGTVRYGTLVKC